MECGGAAVATLLNETWDILERCVVGGGGGACPTVVRGVCVGGGGSVTRTSLVCSPPVQRSFRQLVDVYVAAALRTMSAVAFADAAPSRPAAAAVAAATAAAAGDAAGGAVLGAVLSKIAFAAAAFAGTRGLPASALLDDDMRRLYFDGLAL